MTHPITTYLNSIQDSYDTRTATEHTYRSALEDLIEALGDDIRAINEPAHVQCGAPDLAIWRGDFIIGHIEAKDVDIPLDREERTEQLQRYRQALENLILTNYLEFRWYVKGEIRQTVQIARLDSRGNLQFETGSREALSNLLTDFLLHQPQSISSPRELAERMARLTHLIRDAIVSAFDSGTASDTLTGWRQAFASVLIPDLDQPEHLGQFADMFAQTLSYGLFTARIMHQTGDFNRHTAQGYIPKTNPFLRDFFRYITGPDLPQEPYGGYVEDLIQLLALSDMHAILADFGRGNRQDDPMMHFYETFLAAYDPQLREKRGVYYTPMPVVSFIVRSVDELLKTRFDLPRGLADITRLPDGTPKVLVLDPAVGTATFLYAVIDLIREEFMARNDAGSWSSYVRDHLLDRIFGFEIMMAPYAVAHFKLALELAAYDLDLPEEQRQRWAYDFQSDDRIQIYLTNTLEVLPEEPPSLIGPMKFVTKEAKAADAVKQEKPIMVVLGNPPYSVSSANKGEHIEDLMDRYKEAVRGERNIQPLSDDYIKFIRFAHDRIERSGYGIVAMITNNSFLSGLIHRGMRKELSNSFNEIFIVNLHGNSLLGEINPKGGIDENVFDIRQGVSVILMIKKEDEQISKTKINYADLWGRREYKYRNLLTMSLENVKWESLKIDSPYFFFTPKDFTFIDEYDMYRKLENIFNTYSSGMNTLHDNFVINFERDKLVSMIDDATNKTIQNGLFRKKYNINDSRDWKLEDQRRIIQNSTKAVYKKAITQCVYRPFDFRWIILHDDFVGYPRWETTYQFLFPNSLGLITSKQSNGTVSCLCSKKVLGQHKIVDPYNRSYIFPLYQYPENSRNTLFDLNNLSQWTGDPSNNNRIPNLNPDFISELSRRMGINFDSTLSGLFYEINDKFGPEDVLAYIYSIFHSPSYRERYMEFLKIDFPRIPITSDVDLFRTLVYLGRELINLHLMESPKLADPAIRYPVPGDNVVAARGGYPKYTSQEGDSEGRVYINREQYFESIPQEVWEFEIGGYQVLHKWLKDRRGRALDYEDQLHYKKVVVALSETIRIMGEIDEAIPGWPLE
ncbi:N-6 DNA methylase [Chloroflexota bacterium]|nr:N-6 DNA methylase [Chloroflexota bacterium]